MRCTATQPYTGQVSSRYAESQNSHSSWVARAKAGDQAAFASLFARYERRKPSSFPDAGDLDETIVAEWPDDPAAAMLEAWRRQRARQGLRAMRWAADVDSAEAAQAVNKLGAFPG